MAQEPQGPPPPTGKGVNAGAEDHDLLPDLGRIGAQVALFGGVSWNPYEVGRGAEIGGYVDLPLRRTSGGKLAYELFLGVGFATSPPFTISTPYVNFPLERSVRTRLRLLHLSPFGLKYKLQSSDAALLRPYLNAGVDVVFSSAEEEFLTGTAPVTAFDAPEFAARGLPRGEGDIAIGGHGAAGLEIRLTSGIFLNLEYRFTATEGRNGRLHTATSSLGIRF